MTLAQNIQKAAEAFNRAEFIVVSTGSGISRESGIHTFREAQTGLWEKYDPEELATPQAYYRNPDFVWKWYQYRFGLVSDAEPNPGHYAVAELESLVSRLVLLTQNIDNLHARAGSTDVVELHGNISRFKCSVNCQGDPTVIDLNTIDHDEDHAPHCPYCDALVRPDVVWFGENLPAAAIDRAFAVSAQCDLMLVVGTSGIVQPAASLPMLARRSGAVVIEVNPNPSQITPLAHIFLQGPSGEVLPRLVDAVREARSG
ncbi:MAG: NAD-dependent deacylase [Anaerolineae bacterium]|nr:NAD-dependent deacylase [Anaerolineae bacterium]